MLRVGACARQKPRFQISTQKLFALPILLQQNKAYQYNTEPIQLDLSMSLPNPSNLSNNQHESNNSRPNLLLPKVTTTQYNRKTRY